MSEKVVPGARTFSAYVATGGVALIALAALNLIADRTKLAGVQRLRAYVTHTAA